MRINFKNFEIPTGISQKNKISGDVRENFADLLYLNVNGIKSHALALKIYNSDGETEFSDEEIKTIKSVAEQMCSPSFIDGLNWQLEKTEQ